MRLYSQTNSTTQCRSAYSNSVDLRLLSVQYNAWHWTDIQSLDCMSVCLSEIPIVHDMTAVFVRSSSNLECRSHSWQRRLSSMVNNTGSSKRACASIYFRFSSLVGFCPLQRYHFSSGCYKIWYVHSFCQLQEHVLSVTQPWVICANARNLTSGFWLICSECT